jgi:hypothetical protein
VSSSHSLQASLAEWTTFCLLFVYSECIKRVYEAILLASQPVVLRHKAPVHTGPMNRHFFEFFRGMSVDGRRIFCPDIPPLSGEVRSCRIVSHNTYRFDKLPLASTAHVSPKLFTMMNICVQDSAITLLTLAKRLFTGVRYRQVAPVLEMRR